MLSTGKSVQLLSLLAEYAAEHGKDCEPGLTVVALASDLAASLVDEYAPASRLGEWRDVVRAGLLT